MIDIEIWLNYCSSEMSWKTKVLLVLYYILLHKTKSIKIYNLTTKSIKNNIIIYKYIKNYIFKLFLNNTWIHVFKMIYSYIAYK